MSPSTFNCSNVSSGASLPTVWINEIHYDNSGTDVNEFVEIAGTAGINLSDYAIIRFNGSNPSAAVIYSTPAQITTLTGTMPNQSNGFGTFAIYYPVDGLQNGPNDGIALVKLSTSTVIQLLSYEGAFTVATGQAWASGQTSVNLPFSEDGTIANGSIKLAGSGNKYSDFTWQSQTATANPGSINVGQTFTTISSGNAVTLTVTDGSGNQSTGTAYVTVVDNIAPSLTPAANQNVNLGASCSIVVPDVRGTATDNCAGVTITQSPVAGSSISLTHNQTTNITVTATDASGNATVKTVVLTAKDVTPPVLTPAANQNVNLNTSCSIVVPDVRGTATDNCTGVTITQSPVTGTVIPLAHNQTYNVTVTATDLAGLTDVKTVVLTAKDVTAPTVITKNITVQLDANGSASITPADVNNGSTDNCGTVNLVSVSPATFNCTNVVNGIPTDLFISEYIEGSGNIKAIEIFNGTSNNINLSNYAIRFYSNGSTSIGTTINLTGTVLPGDVYVLATSTASSTILAQADQTSTASFYNGNDAVTLAKNGTNIDIFGRIGEDPGAGGWTAVGGYATTDKTLRRKTNVVAGISSNPTSGFPTLATEWEVFPTDNADGIGKHGLGTPVALTVNDGNGNTSTGIAYVKVEDKIKPVITTNGDKNVNTDPGVCGATVTVSASATDNCSVGAVTGVRSDGKPLTDVFPVGTTTIKWNVTDINGNAAVEVTQTVVVTDNEKPVITTNGDKNVNTDPGVCGATVTVSASATDNCSVGMPTGVRSDGLALTVVYPVGTTTIKWNVTDVNGNAAIEVTQTVVVTDNEKPVITTNGDKNVNTDPGVCGATVTVSAGATDNCLVGLPSGVRSDAQPLTAVYPVGTTTIKWNVTDVNGNAAIEVTQTVVVTDNEKPVITTNGDKTVNTDPGVCGATVTVSASATDNCSVGTVTGVRSDGFALTAVYPVGTTTIKWNVTDVNGNAAIEVTQTVVVTDNEKPVITTNGDKTVNTDPGVCGATVTVSASATDNCSVGTVTGVRSDGKPLTDVFPVGTTTIKWNVTDVNGNAAIEVTQTVVVTDNEKPVITCPVPAVSYNTDLNECNATLSFNAVVTDNCSVASTKYYIGSTEIVFPYDFAVGTTTVKVIATDIHHNSNECSFNVVVKDNQMPTVVTQNIILNLDNSGNAVITASQIDNGSSDNCGIATISLSKTSFDCGNVGTNTVTLTVTDIHGNISTGTATVTVKDVTAPVANCKPVTVYLGMNGSVTIAAEDINNNSTDACGIQSLSLSQSTFTASGNYNVELTVTDVNGNSSTCNTTVTVNKRPVSLVYSGDVSEQYSDQATLSATLVDALTSTPLSGKTITFTIGTQNVNGITTASGIASALLILTQDPDQAYTVQSSFAGDGTYLPSNDNDGFDITDEDARVVYTGLMFQATPSTSTSTATVTLQATVMDITAAIGDNAYDVFAGDIRNAKVRFINRDNNTYLTGWLTPALLNQADQKVGTVSSTYTFDIGQSDAQQFTIGIEVGTPDGYYVRSSSDDNTVLTVYKPLGDFVVGGGFIKPTQSSGTYASTSGLKMNFGLNVKYNKKGTNLQGGVNIIFRRNVAGVIRTYQIKSNSMTSLGVGGTTAKRKAQFLSKANLTDVTDPLNTISLGGNLDLRVDLADNGEPGSADSIAVTLFSGTNSLLFSSNWAVSKTNPLVLTGGNIQINGANFGAIRTDGSTLSNVNTVSSPFNEFNVKVFGNPTQTSFKLQLQSSDMNEKITVKVVDVTGRIIQVNDNLYSGAVIELGGNYGQGTYFAEVTQGYQRKVVKLVKAARN